MGMSFIAPEHICLAVLSGGSEESRRLLSRLGQDTDRLQMEAAKRLKGEAESEGAAAAAASAATRKPVAVSLALLWTLCSLVWLLLA